MDTLPARLRGRLHEGLHGVVAPVEVGAGQPALRKWARAASWTVLDALPGPGARRWLWCPATHTDLRSLSGEHYAALILSMSDLSPDEDDWNAALSGASPDWRQQTFAAFGRWPAAMELLARLLAQQGTENLPPVEELHRHPLMSVLVAPYQPSGSLRAAAVQLAAAALVTPAVADGLDVERHHLETLSDEGWLWPSPGGWAFPELLRRTLAPVPDPRRAIRAAQALQAAGHMPEALLTLATAQAWSEYLELLAQNARAGQGEATLREQLASVPEHWRQAPAAQYLAGLLARSAGDLNEAEALYSQALSGLPEPLVATVHNARGVVRAMRGSTEGALADFEVAEAGSGVTAGEASQNRALLLIQTGRHAEAELSLGRAVAAFRAAGDSQREARSLETLGGLQFGRGLLREALPPYAKALTLYAGYPRDAAMTHLNLAEVHAALGDVVSAESELHLAQALMRARETDGDVAGWALRVQALLALHGGQPSQALHWLGQVQTADRTLHAETSLLLARAYREAGDPERAAVSLEGARQLGLRADLEAALQGQGDLDRVIAEARGEEARLELATALLERGNGDDLTETLELIRTHGYLPLLSSRAAGTLVSMAQDAETRALFPLRVQALGPLRVQHAGRTLQLVDFPTRKSAALLVALALSQRPQNRETLAERFWPGAKNPVASLQTALYHLRSVFGTPLVTTERGQVSMLFPVHSDLDELRSALNGPDLARLAELLRPMTAPLSVFSDLPTELPEEREQAERLVHDALRIHVHAQPAGDARRRDALRVLITADPLDLDSRMDLIRWHELHGEQEAAEQERRHLEQARQDLEAP
ncbi:transcriptional regulator [Deinococcus deserti]|uniref:Putative transcriptional regulator n=1 Tax=Deinococcus deserti (strain DSM 17065 / CIP 109153 / LMG 22923 / VCD115) TaxID=546414 RepID=C1D3A2_DEIDV|nr:transcriptional regulator [Deinococcus deserti]ACO47891.2 putative transcriptional regulator [Deinococcus deserti VCD115]